jgi:hypothetical protein
MNESELELVRYSRIKKTTRRKTTTKLSSSFSTSCGTKFF